jgi:glucoside 3-dehydrogenase (cytochrome c) hitch-hiker subunit
LTRRNAAWAITRAAAVVGGQEFFGDWLSAAQTHTHGAMSAAPPEPEKWANYQPKFFSPEEFKMLEQFTAILIPTDETPGAREAHVAPFIDFVVNAAAEYARPMQVQWRGAMDVLRKHEFSTLTNEQQVKLITKMAAPELGKAEKDEGFKAYRLIKEMTIHAFYTSRIGMIDVLEYKGNAYLTEFPGCNHPEHHKA